MVPKKVYIYIYVSINWCCLRQIILLYYGSRVYCYGYLPPRKPFWYSFDSLGVVGWLLIQLNLLPIYCGSVATWCAHILLFPTGR